LSYASPAWRSAHYSGWSSPGKIAANPLFDARDGSSAPSAPPPALGRARGTAAARSGSVRVAVVSGSALPSSHFM